MKWLTIEEDGCIIVLPETDTKPHGFPKEGAAELAGLECPCKPRVVTGDGERVYGKPLVIHNSFEDEERIAESLKKIAG